MILSHAHRFILVKTRKTASTSLERALIPHLGPKDVWTPLTLPEVEGQNYYSLWPPDLLTAKWFRARELLGREHWLHFRYAHDHMPIHKIRRWLPAASFSSYRKFAFDRNPWDFAVSLWFYLRRKSRFSMEFDQYLHEYPIIPNWDLYTEDGKVTVDHVFRFEELGAGVRQIEADTGLAIGTLPDDKRGYRENREYRSFYTPSSRDLVAQRWKPTISLLGYDF
jgi:hypothetical protein